MALPSGEFGIWQKREFIFFALLAVVLLFAPYAAFAQGGLVPCGGPGQNPCTICDFGILAINIVNFLIYNIAVPLAGLMIVVGGAMITFGAASEQRVETGKKILTNAIIGVVIVFTAWLAVDTVIKVLVGGEYRNFRGALEKFGPWNLIPSGVCPFGGGAVSPPNPTPSLPSPASTPTPAPSPGSSPAPTLGQTPVPQPPVTEEEFSDEIFDETTISVDQTAGEVKVQGPEQTGTFDVKEGAGIAYVRETYPNVFIMGENDLSLQGATRLKAALDEAASMLPAGYNVKDKIILIPTESTLNIDLYKTAGGEGSRAGKLSGFISKNNVIVYSELAWAQGVGVQLSKNGITDTMVHELAHVRGNELLADTSEEWLLIHDTAKQENIGFVSDYAKKNFTEDFADTAKIASFALEGKTKAYSGVFKADNILEMKYKYLAKKGIIKAVPPRP